MTFKKKKKKPRTWKTGKVKYIFPFSHTYIITGIFVFSFELNIGRESRRAKWPKSNKINSKMPKKNESEKDF